MLPSYLNTIINFLSYAFFYLLFSLPLTLSYRTTRVINFAHANFITYGIYTAVFLDGLLGCRSLLLALLLAFIVSGAISLVNYFCVFKPLEERGAPMPLIMIASMGLWIMYNYLLYMLADIAHALSGVNFVSYGRILYSDVPEVAVGEIKLSQSFVAVSLVALATVAFLYVFLDRTPLGKAVRAVADNPLLAEISGIPRGLVVTLTWFLAGGIAGMGGAIWTSFSGTVTPTSGDAMILQVFTVAFIGGLVSLLRTGIGAFIIAFIENVGISVLNTWLGVPTSFRPFLTFATLLTILIVSPPLGAAGGLPFRYRRKGGGAK
ncbi:MAG: branched-chain amino acid ABC transporter permease [Thermofilum sp.]|nr:branched-chain amino acid ABC transporter permease [Thermofilum sp.]